jgi:hypothetical protein
MNGKTESEQFILPNKSYRQVIGRADILLYLFAKESHNDPDRSKIVQSFHAIENMGQDWLSRDRKQGLGDCIRMWAKASAYTGSGNDNIDHGLSSGSGINRSQKDRLRKVTYENKRIV